MNMYTIFFSWGKERQLHPTGCIRTPLTIMVSCINATKKLLCSSDMKWSTCFWCYHVYEISVTLVECTSLANKTYLNVYVHYLRTSVNSGTWEWFRLMEVWLKLMFQSIHGQIDDNYRLAWYLLEHLGQTNSKNIYYYWKKLSKLQAYFCFYITNIDC